MKLIFWMVFACCVLERLWELYRSARNQQQLRENGFQNQERFARRILMVGFHSAWIASTFLEGLHSEVSVSTAFNAMCAGAVVAAFALRVWTLSTLGGHWNISIMAPSETSRGSELFVSTGPYRYIRHPNYLAVILELAFIPLLGGAYRTALIFSVLHACVLFTRIREEERYLFSRPGYREAVGSLPRFVPRIPF